MTIDNFNLIEDNFINPINKGDFYLIQIIKRRKDNPDLPRDMKLIDNYYIYSKEKYVEKKGIIINQCIQNNARAYIRLNKRNDKKVALQTLKLIAENVAAENYDIKNCYLSACGQYHSDPDKKWLVDIDEYPSIDYLYTIQNNIKNIYNKYMNDNGKIYSVIPTLNGVHIICSPFNLQAYNTQFEPITVHKDNPTLLFYTKPSNR